MCMLPGKYSSRGLGNPSGGYSCIKYVVLRNANFQNANVSCVDFSRSDLRGANLRSRVRRLNALITD